MNQCEYFFFFNQLEKSFFQGRDTAMGVAVVI